MGIPAEVQRKLFTPFFTTKAKGSGLGRAIAHRLAIGGADILLHDLDPGQASVYGEASGPEIVAAEIESLATERGITCALHPHVGTLIETAAQVERGLAETTVGWCLDTGHLVIGGTDPAQFARRVTSLLGSSLAG